MGIGVVPNPQLPTPSYFSWYWPFVQWQDSRLWICEWWFESTRANQP